MKRLGVHIISANHQNDLDSGEETKLQNNNDSGDDTNKTPVPLNRRTAANIRRKKLLTRPNTLMKHISWKYSIVF